MINENLTAIISLKALRKNKVNWVLHDEPVDVTDSGWQLFYGDESEDYLDEPANSATILLQEVLAFEPLLGAVFSVAVRADAYEWNGNVGKYTEAVYETDDEETEADWEE